MTGRGPLLPGLDPQTRALLVSVVIAAGVALAALAMVTLILVLAAAFTSGVAA